MYFLMIFLCRNGEGHGDRERPDGDRVGMWTIAVPVSLSKSRVPFLLLQWETQIPGEPQISIWCLSLSRSSHLTFRLTKTGNYEVAMGKQNSKLKPEQLEDLR